MLRIFGTLSHNKGRGCTERVVSPYYAINDRGD
jgi:hypothetical protein